MDFVFTQQIVSKESLVRKRRNMLHEMRWWKNVFCRSTSLIRFPESKCDVIRARCVIVLSQYSAYFLADEKLIDLIEAAHKKDFQVPSEMIVDRWTLLAWFLRTEENN